MMNRWFIAACIFIVSLKILILPFASFPFDFATYVYQGRQFFEYNLSPIFFWNKGSFLLLIFYADYGLYTTVLSILQFTKDNMLLVQFVFKFAFLLFDLILAFYIQKIISLYTKNTRLAAMGFILWLANPLAFWIIEIQGQYAIIASCFVIVSLYYALAKKKYLSLISLAIASSVYYYSILFAPLFFLFFSTHIHKNKIIEIVKNGLLFSFFLLILFAPFLIEHQYFTSLISSLVHHAKPDASGFQDEVFIPYYSLFNLPYYLIYHIRPSNLISPEYFSIVSSLSTLAGLIFASFYLLRRYILVLFYQKLYNQLTFLQDIAAVLLIFLLLVGKFQTHYLLWLIPVLIIYAIVKQQGRLILWITILSILPILNTIGVQDLGIYFLDAIRWGGLNLWLAHSEMTLSINGFLGMFILIYLLFVIILNNKYSPSLKPYETILMLLTTTTFFIIMFGFVIAAYATYPYFKPGTKLASDGNVHAFPLTVIPRTSTTFFDRSENTYDIVGKSDVKQVQTNIIDDPYVLPFYTATIIVSLPYGHYEARTVTLNDCKQNRYEVKQNETFRQNMYIFVFPGTCLDYQKSLVTSTLVGTTTPARITAALTHVQVPEPLYSHDKKILLYILAFIYLIMHSMLIFILYEQTRTYSHT